MKSNNEKLQQCLTTYLRKGFPFRLSVLETFFCGCFHTYGKVARLLVKQCRYLGYISINNENFKICIK